MDFKLCNVNFFNNTLKELNIPNNQPLLTNQYANKKTYLFNSNKISIFSDIFNKKLLPGFGNISILIIKYWNTKVKNIYAHSTLLIENNSIIYNHIKEIDVLFFISNDKPTLNDINYYNYTGIIDKQVKLIDHQIQNKYFCFIVNNSTCIDKDTKNIVSSRYFNKIINIMVNIFVYSNKNLTDLGLSIKNMMFKFGIFKKKVKIISDINSTLYCKYSCLDTSNFDLVNHKKLLNTLSGEKNQMINIYKNFNILQNIYSFYFDYSHLVIVLSDIPELLSKLYNYNFFYLKYNSILDFKNYIKIIDKINIKLRKVVFISDYLPNYNSNTNNIHIIKYSPLTTKNTEFDNYYIINNTDSILGVCKKIFK